METFEEIIHSLQDTIAFIKNYPIEIGNPGFSRKSSAIRLIKEVIIEMEDMQLQFLTENNPGLARDLINNL